MRLQPYLTEYLSGFVTALIVTVLAAIAATFLIPDADAADAATPCPSYVASLPEAEDYKTLRLREMADLWRCTGLEDQTIPLLAMLLTEDGTITAERRHDCRGGTCYAIGLQGHHICKRGGLVGTASEGRTFCTWKDGKSPLQQFEALHPDFAFEWRIQFAYYSDRVRELTEVGNDTDAIIRSWNPREKGRRAKVRANEPLVRAARGL